MFFFFFYFTLFASNSGYSPINFNTNCTSDQLHNKLGRKKCLIGWRCLRILYSLLLSLPHSLYLTPSSNSLLEKDESKNAVNTRTREFVLTNWNYAWLERNTSLQRPRGQITGLDTVSDLIRIFTKTLKVSWTSESSPPDHVKSFIGYIYVSIYNAF